MANSTEKAREGEVRRELRRMGVKLNSDTVREILGIDICDGEIDMEVEARVVDQLHERLQELGASEAIVIALENVSGYSPFTLGYDWKAIAAQLTPEQVDELKALHKKEEDKWARKGQAAE